MRALERGSIAVLVASAFLQVFTGIANGAGWHVFGFGFTQFHFAFAWVAIGALVIHIAVKLPVIRTALSAPLEAPDDDAATDDAADSVRVGGDRRWFIRGALGVSVGALALTVGSTIRPLESLSLLRTRRPSTSPGGVPVNRTALQAGIGPSTDEGSWRVALSGPGGTRSLGLAELLAMPQVTADLPIACVEGWSAGATWSGVRMRDLLALVGGSGADVRVDSAERSGGYRQTVLPAAYAAHPDTLVALQMNGAALGRPRLPCSPHRPQPGRGPADQVGRAPRGDRVSTTAAPTTPSTPSSPVLRASLVATGVLLALVGAYAFAVAVPPGQWVRVALWTAGGVAAHDGVIAPVAIALGWFLARNAPARRRRVMRTSLLAVTTVVLILVPLLATGGLRF